MARVTFTPQLERFLDVPCAEAEGGSVHDVLLRVFEGNARLRAYVLDEHGRLRRHVNIFVNGSLVQDRVFLTDPVPPGGDLFVLQALSGG